MSCPTMPCSMSNRPGRGGLTPELEQLATRAGLAVLPAAALAWSVPERAFVLTPWPLQRAYLAGLADRPDPADDPAYAAMAEHAVLRIAHGIAPERVRSLVCATLAARGRPPLPAARLVACIADLGPLDIDLLRLFDECAGARADRADLALGERAANLDSERAVDAAAERLQRQGLVHGNPDIMPDFSRRSLMPRRITALGRALLSLAPSGPLGQAGSSACPISCPVS